MNYRLVKIHRSYTVEEAARLLQTHKNTIRAWIKRGLPTLDCQRPTLIHGLELSRFLKCRRERAKDPCPPGHLYCVRCRAPKPPAASMVDYLPITSASGNLRGICPDCEALMHRHVSRARLNEIGANLEITFTQPPARISDMALASENCDSRTAGGTDEDA